MLGSVAKGRTWCWAAVGKHPAAADYIHLGAASPLLDALSEWAVKGYDELLSSNSRSQEIHSWRFWLRGVKKGTLVCGLVRDSSDRIGRPFPLLIMGEGLLKGWEKHWRMLAAQLNRTWKNCEYIASRRFDDAHAMEEEIGGLNQPETVGMGGPAEPADGDRTNNFSRQVSECRQQILANGYGLINLDSIAGMDADRAVMTTHEALHACCKDIPRGIFIGGTCRHTFLAVIEHPLGTADFVRLWTV